MLSVDSINRGVVIDHIKAGKSMSIYKYLGLDKVDSPIAILKNVKSNKMGKKDVIKIENRLDINMDILGFVDPNITVNIIDEGKIIKKLNMSTPKSVEGIVKCKNPRCITSSEADLKHIFKITENNTYRCVYCEEKMPD